MSRSDVLIVLTCYSRPQNMPSVIKAWREQTVQCRIVVADNSPPYQHDEQGPYPANGLCLADDVWRWTENSGCPCWLAPAVMLYGHKYVLRADDDFLPGRRAVEHLLATAKMLNDEFSTIGQVGRIFGGISHDRYVRSNVPRDNVTRAVDLTCRVSFMRSVAPSAAICWRNMLLTNHPSEETSRLVGVHDDFLLCCGTQSVTKFPSYVTARTDDPETELIRTEIPNGTESCYKRPGHYEEREAMVQLCVKAGWRSLT